MSKLNQEDQFVPTKENLAELLSGYGIRDFEFRVPSSGVENATLIIESENGAVVLRVYRQGKKSGKDIEREIDFMTVLKRKGIPVPGIIRNQAGEFVTLFKRDNRIWQAIMMEFVGGTHPTAYGSLIEQLATIQATAHLVGIEYAAGQALTLSYLLRNRLNVDEYGRIEAIIASSADVKSEVEFIRRSRDAVLELPKSIPTSLNHLDYDIENVLVKDGKVVAVLDWDDLECTPSVQCLGYTLLHILYLEGDESVRRYLASYEKIRPLSDDERNLLKPIMRFRNYQLTTVYLLMGENPADVVRNGIVLEEKIKKFEKSI